MITKKVMVVDDDPLILELLQKGIELAGHSVQTACSTTEFNTVLTTFNPDVILMDISMPELDGISLMRDIRFSPKTNHIPVVILTAFSDVKTYQDAMFFGASDYITKPFEISDVLKKIEEVTLKASKEEKK